MCSETWETTLKSKQNSIFATRLQPSRSAYDTFDLCVKKKHHGKEIVSFGYLQALGVENVTFANGGVRELK